MKAAGWLSGLWTLAVLCGLLAASCATQLDKPKVTLAAPPPPTLHTQAPVPQAKLQVTYAHVPLHFEPNQGQTDEQVHFLSRGRGYTLFLTSTAAVLALRQPCEDFQQNPPALCAAPFAKGAFGSPPLTKEGQGGFRQQHRNTVDSAPLEQTALRMQFVGANPNPQIAGHEELPGQVNYFIGNDPDKWHTDIPTFAKVKYQDVYPGVDLVYYGNQQQLEFDFVVAPGADPKTIRLTFDGLVGARRAVPKIDANGDLILPTDSGEVRLRKPLIYQEIDGVKQLIPGGYVLLPLPLGEGRGEGQPHVGFEVAAYDRSKPLIIDPVLSYSTYLGGNGEDRGYGIAVDATGNAYITGLTYSTDLPTGNSFQRNINGPTDAFIAKLDLRKNQLVYLTYLGGSDYENLDPFIGTWPPGGGIAVDTDGNAYVSGRTKSPDFPVQHSAQSTYGGNQDVFVTKLNATGTELLYSSYLGGSGHDWAGSGIAVDAAGHLYVIGFTGSSDFPTNDGATSRYKDGWDVFVTEFDPSAEGAASLVSSSYLGGTRSDYGMGIAVDPQGIVYITGFTDSGDFPTVNAFENTNDATPYKAFVAKLEFVANSEPLMLYSTFLGGSADDRAYSIAIDNTGDMYVTGYTSSEDFPTKNAFSGTPAVPDAFLVRLNPTRVGAESLIYSTYLGGGDREEGLSVAVDSNKTAYVTGLTNSLDFPTKNAFETTGGLDKVFVTALNTESTGVSSLVYSTYLGGTSNGTLYSNSYRYSAIAVGLSGIAYLTGQTFSDDFPTVNPFQAANAGYDDAFVARIGEEVPKSVMEAIVTDATNHPLGNVWVVLTKGASQAFKKVDAKKTGADGSVSFACPTEAGYLLPVSSGSTATIDTSQQEAQGLVFEPGFENWINGKKACRKTLTFVAKNKPREPANGHEPRNFHWPLQGQSSWRIVTEVGGYVLTSGLVDADPAHTDRSKSGFYALDISAPEGTDVVPADDGYVMEVQPNCKKDKNFGCYVVLQHADGYYTLYAHLSKSLVQKDLKTKITRASGRVIGKSGSTGVSASSHLHFNVYFGGIGRIFSQSDNPKLVGMRLEGVPMVDYRSGRTYP